MAWLYSFVGLVIGSAVWAAWQTSMLLFPPLVSGVIALAFWIGLTGGLHLDGLADSCDGLCASVDREKRLEIMADPHIGTFGVLGVALTLLLKAASLTWLTPSSSFALLLAPTLARWCFLWLGLLPPARPSGLGADFAQGFRPRSLVWGAILPFSIAFLLGPRGLMALLISLSLTAWLVGVIAERLQGMTGDVFGLAIEVVEAAVLLVFVAQI